ncbi:hypothetical protein Dxin01_00204 [Deinococcus xinjiangensis]|uniref:Uncharacterized protein n=1 Tax=Deinococcus xinjiangensis TaxID=457454 RepID=A0ABP9VB35_9DEIO
MFTNIVLIIVTAYLIAQLLKSGVPQKGKEFLDMTRDSAKQLGGRGTVHALIDGLFDGGKAAKRLVEDKAVAAKRVASQKAAGLKPADYKYDATSGELIVFVTKGEDLVLGRDEHGRTYALEMSVTGRATELNSKALERKLRYLRNKQRLSDAQERAIKDWFLKERK